MVDEKTLVERITAVLDTRTEYFVEGWPTVDLARLVAKELLSEYWIDAKDTTKYMCCVCHKVPVDADNGFDTCEGCAKRI